MRRSPANLVLAILLWSYLAPVFLVTTELDLPACCRSHGKHHCCSCCMARHDDGTPGFHANSPRCPCRLLGSVSHGSFFAEVRKFSSIQPPPAGFLAPIEAASGMFRDRIRNSGRAPPQTASVAELSEKSEWDFVAPVSSRLPHGPRPLTSPYPLPDRQATWVACAILENRNVPSCFLNTVSCLLYSHHHHRLRQRLRRRSRCCARPPASPRSRRYGDTQSQTVVLG